MNDNIRFLQALARNPLQVGAVVPSSPDLAQQMIEGIKPDKDNVVIELGVGTGAITRYLAKTLPDDRSYLGIELDPSLAGEMSRRFPDLEIVCGNAAEMVSLHEMSGIGKVSYILCGLPFVTLPDEVGAAILEEATRFMDQGCTFRAFQYAHGYYLPAAIRLRRFMRERYGKTKRSKLVAKNLPPAYTLTWSTL